MLLALNHLGPKNWTGKAQTAEEIRLAYMTKLSSAQGGRSTHGKTDGSGRSARRISLHEIDNMDVKLAVKKAKRKVRRASLKVTSKTKMTLGLDGAGAEVFLCLFMSFYSMTEYLSNLMILLNYYYSAEEQWLAWSRHACSRQQGRRRPPSYSEASFTT